MAFYDVHTHAYPKQDRALVVERTMELDGHLPPDSPYKWAIFNDGSVESLVKEEKKAGLDGFVLLPISGRSNGSSRVNRWVAKKARIFPQIIPFASLTPLSITSEADLKEALALGLKGIKLHPFLQRINPLDPKTLACLEMIQPAGLPILMDSMNLTGVRRYKPHMAPLLDYWEPFETGPTQIATLAKTFPRITFIAAHLGCLYGWDQLGPLYDLENVYFDLSYVLEILQPQQIKKLIYQKGLDRLLYGSDAPWRVPAQSWQLFLDLNLPAADFEKIAGQNLQELLKL
jgi:uncharacterized protein